MTMTRKDFVELANHLGMALADLDHAGIGLSAEQETVLSNHLARALRSANPAFRSERFSTRVAEIRASRYWHREEESHDHA